MARRKTRDLTVGVVAALALLVFAVAVMTVGEESHLFARKVGYRVVFANTDGLMVGSPVRIAGVQVGSVVGIKLPTDPEAPGIEVALGVASTYAPRIRENSQAALRYLQLLSGEKFVEVSPGDPSLPALPVDSTIPPAEQTEFFEQGADIAENLNDITISLKEILGPLERGEGLLGEMIHNPEFAKEGIESLRKVVSDLGDITGQIREGKGFVGRMLYDQDFAKTLDGLASAVDHVASMLEPLGKKEGALGALLEEGGSGEQAMEELRDAAASLKRTAARLESKDNFVGKLLNDAEYSERVADDLQAILHNLREVTDKINSGQGTIGALVNERTVHDGMEDVVAGVNDSKFARWLLRRYQKKGIKSQEKDATEEDDRK